jgi:hypothetical protein
MPKIAATLVWPVSSAPRANAVVEVDEGGKILSVSNGSLTFREAAGVSFYSGILVPGLADMMCGMDRDPLWLFSRGIRVAGIPGLLPGISVSEDRTEGSWKGFYGEQVGFRIFNGLDEFGKYFMKGSHDGIFHAKSPSGGLPVLASFGRDDIMQLMLELQDGPARLSLTEILTMVAMNGVKALHHDHIAGDLVPGKTPGLNIIEGADISRGRLLQGSRLRRLL